MGDLLRILLSILLPPLGVALEVGVKNKHFWINIALTILGYIPGIVHAVWVIVIHGPHEPIAGRRSTGASSP